MVSEKSMNIKCIEAPRFVIYTVKSGLRTKKRVFEARPSSSKRCGVMATVSVARIVACNDCKVLQSELLTHQLQSAIDGTVNWKGRGRKR